MSRLADAALVGGGVLLVAALAIDPLSLARGALIFSCVTVCRYIYGNPPG